MMFHNISVVWLVWTIMSPLLSDNGVFITRGENAQAVEAFGDFTGEILPVFYVSDSRVSEDFYRRLGFTVTSYYDYDAGESVTEWTKETLPIYIAIVIQPILVYKVAIANFAFLFFVF